jgi:hypothetical protein
VQLRLARPHLVQLRLVLPRLRRPRLGRPRQTLAHPVQAKLNELPDPQLLFQMALLVLFSNVA